ncbi:MAG: hypothetical protein F6K37_06430 [Moorea sp. SIO4E2]|uniref:hypothetical protein n=1 Tax=Moorena sp. SIO4E2 TaxID=2607826 RepID=UPI0013BA625B|nr:hypothetical protein [Moorena sp. SIO4E2]NEQ05613.1 hypothetical protein [Moorena sp. SIO4E2]
MARLFYSSFAHILAWLLQPKHMRYAHATQTADKVLVAKIANLIYSNGGNIIYADKPTGLATGIKSGKKT